MLDHGEDIGPVLLVVVKDEVARRGIEREGFAKLLDDPRSGRMLGYADVEHVESCRWHDEEVRRGEDLAVVSKEVAPPLLRFGIGGSPWHKPGDRALGNVEAEHEKFAVNALHISRVLGGHTPDQGANLGLREGASDASTTRLPGLVRPKPLSVPAHGRVGLDHEQDLLAPWPEATEREPEDPIGRSHPRSRSLGREDGELLAESEIFDQKVRPRRAETSEPTQDDDDSWEHPGRMVGWESGVNDGSGRDSRYDPPCAKRPVPTRMEFWRATAGARDLSAQSGVEGVSERVRQALEARGVKSPDRHEHRITVRAAWHAASIEILLKIQSVSRHDLEAVSGRESARVRVHADLVRPRPDRRGDCDAHVEL